MATAFDGFRSLVENGPDAVCLIDTRGEILYASASAASVFGYLPDELVGRNSMDLIHLEDRVRMTEKMNALLAGIRNPVEWNARARRKDGSWAWVESAASNMLLYPEVGAISVIHRDVSARKAIEATQRREAEDLSLSNLRLEEFAYTVAHDLREPLRTISAFTQLLVRQTDMDDQSKQAAGFAIDAAKRMATLLDDLLSLASASVDEPGGRVDLQDAVVAAKQNLGLVLDESHAVVSAGPLPLVNGNRGHLVRILQNLIGNAVKYCGPKPPEIHVSAERRGAKWLIRVRDNGIGIATEDQARIFTMFTRLHGHGISGTGIGLAFCKKVVEAAGDRIWVESREGCGSAFCFTIAAASEGTPLSQTNDLLALHANGCS